jgi:ATP-dependent DNA helicase RecG
MDDVVRWSTAEESQYFERKSAYHRDAGQRKQRNARDVAWDIAETLAAMANADGGELIVGVEDDGTISGVPHPPAKLAVLLGAPCSSNYVHPPLACEARQIHATEGLLLNFTVEASPQVHQLADGRYLLRTRDANIPFAADQIHALKLTKTQGLVEIFCPPGATLDAVDLDLIESLQPRLGHQGSAAQFLIESYLAEVHGGAIVPNLAGLLLFGKQPPRWHPRCGIEFVRWSGTERRFGSELNVEKRLFVEAPLALLIGEAYESIKPFIRERQQLQDLLFTERLEYPTYVWQEAIVNAVLHRDYGVQGTQVEVWMFDDRMEVRSPGLPPQPVTFEALNSGQAVHVSRNPRIARTLVRLGYVRELGEGVPRMITEMERQGFYPPRFESVAGMFQVTLRNQPVYDRETLEWLSGFESFDLTGDQKRILAYARAHENRFTSRAFQQLVGLDIYRASNSIRELMRKGVVRSPKRGGRVYEVIERGRAGAFPVPDDLIRIIDDVRGRPITNDDVQRVLGVSRPTAIRYLRSWTALEFLERTGKGSQTRYHFTSPAVPRTMVPG